MDASTWLRQAAIPGGEMFCPVTDTCQRFVTFTADTRLFAYDGLHTLRYMAYGPSGESTKTHRAILRFPVNIQNGNPEQNAYSGAQHAQGCGWYTSPVEYACATMLTPLSSDPITGPKTLSVSWATGSTSLNVVRRFASIDPNFHAGDRGTVLVDQPMNAHSYTGNVTIDPATLAPGVHRLFLRTDELDDLGDNINAGVLVVPFTVG